MKLLSSIFLIMTVTAVAAQFHQQRAVATIKGDLLIEASGIDESYQNPGYFWSHNDSGGKPAIYLLDKSGSVKMEVMLKGVKNRDWEDIVTLQEEGGSSIYIAEIGDNWAKHDQVRLIRIREPKYEGVEKVEIQKDEIAIMTFRYEEGARDAEAVFYDVASGEFVLITKREEQSMVYSFPFEPGDEVQLISSLGQIPDRNFTAADMNNQGEILLKTYNEIYLFEKSDNPAAKRLLSWAPVKISYIAEPQGEAMCWMGDDFYTLSEKNKGYKQELLFFKRAK